MKTQIKTQTPTPRRNTKRTAMALALAIGAAFSAQAHVVLQEPLAAGNAAYRAVLQVGHGCEGADTTAITVDIPPGFNAAQPLVKPGWKVTTVVGKLAEPYTMHGHTVSEGVQQITWSAKGTENALPNALADEFVFRVNTAAKPGVYWFKVLQKCVKGSNPWVEIPSAGQAAHSLQFPAARLEILDVQPAEEHHH